VAPKLSNVGTSSRIVIYIAWKRRIQHCRRGRRRSGESRRRNKQRKIRGKEATQLHLVRGGERYRGYGWELLLATRPMKWECMMVSVFVSYLMPVYYLIRNIIAIWVEWAKAWARTRCWNEEVQLLNEEMRRVLEFHEYKARWWEDRRSRSDDLIISAGLADGIRAYAEGQAQLHRDLTMRFRGMWANLRSGGAISVPTEDEADEIQQPEMEADGDEEASDEEEEEEGVAVEPDWEFITEDMVKQVDRT
jgi:hypothetical protein